MKNTRASQRTNAFVLTLVSISIVVYPLPSFATPTFPDNFALSSIDQDSAAVALEPLPSVDTSEIDPLLEQIEYAAFEIADQYNPALYLFDELLDSLEFDPEQAFQFVRDKIRFEPYRGILRDAEGALGGGAGNAYDKSLLLQRLLEDMGVETRLVFGVLDEQLAENLYNQSLMPADVRDELLPLADLVGFSKTVRERMLSRANQDFNWIDDALSMSGRLPNSTVTKSDVVMDHVWVQARIDSDWEDLDSSFADARRGEVFTKVDRYSTTPESDNRQKVFIQVVAETLENGKLSERTLLEHEMLATDAVQTRTYLTFSPQNPTLGGKLADVLGAEIGFVPVLTVDGEQKPGTRIPGLVGKVSEGQEFLYGTLRAELSGLFLDVKVGTSVESRNVARGVLVDRVPGEFRRAGAVAIDDLHPMKFDDNHPAAFKAIHQILVSNGGSNPRLAAEAVGLAAYFIGRHLLAPDAIDELPMDSVFWPAAMIRNAQLAVNERLLQGALNDHAGTRFFIGEPRVYVMSLSARSGEPDQDVRYSMSVDLLHDPIHVVAGTDTSASLIQQRRIWHGVVQSSFETTLVELLGIIDDGGHSTVLSASIDSAGNSVIFANPKDPRLPEIVPNALLSDLDLGHKIIVSESNVESGIRSWWSVSSDGTTRAMLRPRSGGATIVTWWDDYGGRNSRLPKPYQGNPRSYYVDFEKYDEWAKKASKATKETATRRIESSKKLPKTNRGGGGTEYGIVLNISVFATLGVAGILAVTLVAFSIIGMLYIVGYVVVLERQRKARGY